MKLKLLSKNLACFILGFVSLNVAGQNNYQAPKAQVAPVIDGVGNDACWTNATWYDVNQVWFGVTPGPADFSEKFKVAWDANKLYILGEVTDDIFNDNFANPLQNYWEDDTWEIFIDEDRSGGEHEKSYNAFAYHISKALDVVDVGSDGNPHLYNDHVTVKRTADGTKYTWEAAFDVYTKDFILGAATNPKAALVKGKVMGFAMAYCDNDGGAARQSFIGSEFVAGPEKNVAYKNASVFGRLELVEAVVPTFSHALVSSGLNNPTAFTIAQDGRIFVCEQNGTLKVIKNGTLLGTPVLSLNVNLGDEFYSERGLLGVATDPDFLTNNHIYVFYTTSPKSRFTPDGAHNRVSRFTLNGDVASDEKIIVELDMLSNAINHNGGTLHFGKDGKLYIATGENFLQENAQNLSNTHGKILRLNPDGTIPADNPFATAEDGGPQKKMIWAYGLRNPFTFDIQPGTGRIFINDVGQDNWEEINDATAAGQNFGWPLTEGHTTQSGIAGPEYTYKHADEPSDTTGCAITGGVFFNPATTNYPTRYLGKYFFADYCNNWIALIDPATGKRTEIFASKVSGAPVAMDFGPDGNLYYLSRTNGGVYKIVYSGKPIPQFITHPVSITVPESQPAELKATISGSSPFAYQWLKNGDTLKGATSAVLVLPVTAKADSGTYELVVSNIHGTAKSDPAKLTISAFNSRPEAIITSPATNSLYSGGQSFVITGTGTDAQDGVLPAGAFTWKVVFHHDTHVHDGIAATGSKTIDLTVPSDGETATNVWFRIYLYVKDAGGLTDTAFIELKPRLANLTFATSPAGLVVTIDGQPFVTPVTIPSVVGVKRNLGAPTPQVMNKTGWKFSTWSNNQPVNQVITTPAASTTYTATFVEAPVSRETMGPVKDAYVTNFTDFSPDAAITSFGNTDSTRLIVKKYALGPDRRTYLGFDLSQIIGNPSQLNKATLRLTGIMTREDSLVKIVTVNLYESAANGWQEKQITWTTQPGPLAQIVAGFPVTSFETTSYETDLTEYVKNILLSPGKSFSLVLAATSDSKNRVIFNSKENALSKPELILEYGIVLGTETSATRKLTLYPNPASKMVELSWDEVADVESSLEITDQNSTQVKVVTSLKSTGGNNFSLHVEDLKPGLYFLRLISSGKMYYSKLVIE